MTTATEQFKRPLPVHIRWFVRRDMNQVLGIEHESADHPWEEADFAEFSHRRNVVGIVAETPNGEGGGMVVGFACCEVHKAYIGVSNLTVAMDYRRQGVGTALIGRLVGKLSARRCKIVTAVRESNLIGQLFLRDMGFRAVWVGRQFYGDTDEDAFLFRFTLEHRPEDVRVDVGAAGCRGK